MRFRDSSQTILPDPNSRRLEVIAAGHWRCATSSLQNAFEQILDPPLAPSMHGAYLMPYPSKLRQMVLCQHLASKTARQEVLRDLLQGYNASCDWPGFAFLDDILDLHPHCKIVLNKRSSARAWEDSVRNSLRFYSTLQYHLVTYWLPQSYWHHHLYRGYARLVKRRFGLDDPFSQECYLRHLDWVRAVAAARGKKVLEWEPSDGWEPLCQFLGREVPSQPFPHMNETRELEILTTSLLTRGLVAWSLVLLVVIILCTLALWIVNLRMGSLTG